MIRTVLVTGGGRGIGFETVKAFAAQPNVRVIALDKSFPTNSSSSFPSNVQLKVYDLRRRTDFDFQSLVASLEPVHTLVNNAGTLFCPPPALEQHGLGFTPDQVNDILDTNLRAPVGLIEALAPQMIQRKEGRIVNVGSVSAFTGHPDLWYGVSKAGILNATKTFASLLGKHGVTVNAVAPGPTLTDMYEALPQSRKDMVERTVNSGRPANPSEVAEAILWLGMSAPLYVNGSTLDVNDSSYPR
jgi:3-oxoacyl-[acyl-carrier protein] reductase